MPFGYYRNLSEADRRTYMRSDRIARVDLPPELDLGAEVDAIELALASEKRAAVETAAARLCARVTEALGVKPVEVKIRPRRPRYRTGEDLHGLYTWEEGKRPLVEVWMKTATHRRTVAFRTFLRTLLHEVCHHLDFALFRLSNTFHTEGFFKRESSLVRRIAPAISERSAPGREKAESKASRSAPDRRKKPKPKRKKKEKSRRGRPRGPEQLDLW